MRKGLVKVLAVLVSLSAASGAASGQAPTMLATEAPSRADERAWMRDAGFGMFIHFGLYSIPAGVWKGKPMGRNDYIEWIRTQWDFPKLKGIPQQEYDTLLDRFDPAGFDADRIAGAAQAAGMKYIVLTSKHHDGFALWPSAVGGYDVSHTPFAGRGRDLLGELVAAARRRGLKVGFYYSHWQDWKEPGGAFPVWMPPARSDAAFQRYWQGKALPQVRELLERYQPDMLWFDTWEQQAKDHITAARRDELIALIHRLSPRTLINGRIAAHDPAGADFLSMMDNEFPPADAPEMPWETPATMSRSWGHSVLNYDWLTSERMVRMRMDAQSRGGALTLNIGPDGTGAIPAVQLRRLRELAAWEEVNREAVEGVRPWAYRLPYGDHAITMREQGDTTIVYVARFEHTPRLSIRLPDALAGGEIVSAKVIETDQVQDAGIRGDRLSLTFGKQVDLLSNPVVRIAVRPARPVNAK